METLIYHISYALGWSILHSLWQAAMLYILLCIGILCIPAITAKIKYNLAMGIQLVIFINFVITFIYFYQQYNIPITMIGMSPQELTTNLLLPQKSSFSLAPLFPYLVSGYVIGFFIQLLLLSKGLLNLRNLKYKGLSGIPEHWGAILRQAKGKFQMTEGVNFYLSNKITTPLTLGYFKPIILFPMAYINHMDEKQIEAILLHELAHIKRNDFLFNLIKVAVETLLFFNPFVWAISKIIEKEREHACDEMVVKKIPTAMHYIQTLVELEELRHSLTPAMAMAATGKKSQLLNRIKRITNSENSYANIKEKLVAVILSGLSLCLLTFIFSIKQSQAAEKNETRSDIIYDETIIESISLDTIPPKPPVNAREIPPTPIKPAKQSHLAPPPPKIDTVKESVRERKSLQKKLEDSKVHHNSKEWKDQINKITAESLKMSEQVNKQVNSKEWKDQIKKITAESLKMSEQVNKQVNSKEWKDQIKKITAESLKMSEQVNKQVNSKEWKDQIKKITAESLKMSEQVDKQVNSKEWKDQIKKIEQTADQIQEYFESDQWKEQVKELESPSKASKEK